MIMNSYYTLKNEILQINQELIALFSGVKSMSEMTGFFFGDWEKTCGEIDKHISEEIVRVAVVGPIKSGKSTFTNSLFKGDYLKRGAGVVTSIVTKIRIGETLKAKLFFKSWDEVNSEIKEAMVLFPSLNQRSKTDGFDIRRKKDRADLQQAIGTLETELLITDDARNTNSVLLSSYLKGYDRVKDIVCSDTKTWEYEDDLFGEHRAFAGDDALAAYLKDIQLQINSGSIGNNIEIADCQGSDSPNPLHLAMIQDYLLLTHFIIYVISSRTGLRRADIRFLSMIKKMGIMDNIIFIINCDFSEHESINDLKSLIERIKEDILLIKPEPEIYALSSLFNLFKAQGKKMTQKDRQRLAQWEKEEELVNFSDKETESFESSFNNKLEKETYSILFKNHLERLCIISDGLCNWARVNHDILVRDAGSVNEIIKKVKSHQGKMDQIKLMVNNTLDGAVQKIRHKIKLDIDRFFDGRSGEVLKDIIGFIRNYKISYNEYEENIDASGFSNTLYLIFQEFKQALDTYLAETVNPRVIRFVRDEEKSIEEYFESVVGPFYSVIQDASVTYADNMSDMGIPLTFERRESIKLLDLKSIRSISGLTLSPATASMRYTAMIKIEGVMRLGFYTLVNIFKKILKKPIQNGKEEKTFALNDSVLRIKREMEKSIIYHFKNYKENMKFQYFDRLVEAAANNFYEALIDRFQVYSTDLSKIVELVSEKRVDKEQALRTLKEVELTSVKIGERIDRVRKEMQLAV